MEGGRHPKAEWPRGHPRKAESEPELPTPEAQGPAPGAQRLEFRLPDLGEGVESADVVRVLVKPGDTVQEGQDLVELDVGGLVGELGDDVEPFAVREGDLL